jgi:hypothetical protein
MYIESYINTEFLGMLDCIDQASFSKPENNAKTTKAVVVCHLKPVLANSLTYH